jgi:hypothetical protein
MPKNRAKQSLHFTTKGTEIVVIFLFTESYVTTPFFVHYNKPPKEE